jgi:hypothetical protein
MIPQMTYAINHPSFWHEASYVPVSLLVKSLISACQFVQSVLCSPQRQSPDDRVFSLSG